MKFFIDTAKVEDIKEANDMGVICGVTTNPSLIAKEGRDFNEVIKEITTIVDGPISGEVKATTTDAEGMIREGREIAAIHPNMVVKIPMTTEGLKAVKVLSSEGIKTNVTLIFSANQALLAARAVATIEGTTNVYPQNLEETLYLFGETGTVKLGGKSTNNIDVWNFADETEEDQANKGLEEATSNVYGNGHTSLYADVIDAIENDRAPYVDAYAGRNALELVLAIYKSQKEGKAVKLPLDKFASVDMTGEF